MKNCLLEIANIIVSTKIGITDRERESDQSMLISIKIEFKYEPRICSTDNIDDGICYMFLINNIINLSQPKRFAINYSILSNQNYFLKYNTV